MLSFRLLLLLFVALRVESLLLFKPGGRLFGEGDFIFYRNWAALALEGHLPWIGYWSEYPPLFPWLATGVFLLSSRLPGWPDELTWFQVGLSLILTAADAGNLALIRSLGERVGGPTRGMVAATLWALLFFPIYVTLSWFDTLPLFFMLLGLWLALRDRPAAAGLAIGLGVLAKLIPGIAAPFALRRWWPDRRRPAIFVVVAAATILAAMAPLLLLGGPYARASLRALLDRPAWLTVWALLAGDTDVPFVSTERLRPEAVRWEAAGGAVWLLLGLALVGLFIWLLSRRLDWRSHAVMLAACGVGLLGFLLLNRGHSPQFLLYVVAFAVITLPPARAVGWCIALQAVGFVEWPFGYTVLETERWLRPVAILVRTGLYAAVAAELGAIAFDRPLTWPRLLARSVPAVSAVALAAMIALTLWRLPAQGAHAPVAAYLRAEIAPADADAAIVVSSSELRWQLAPYRAAGTVVDLSRSALAEETAAKGALEEVARNGPLWVVVDYRRTDVARHALLEGHLAADTPVPDDRWFEHLRLIGFASPSALPPTTWTPATARYPEGPSLTGWAIVGGHPAPDARIRVALRWTSPGLHADAAAAFGRRKLFIHLLDDSGDRVGQHDAELARVSGPRRLLERDFISLADVPIAPIARPGPTRLAIGLYDATTGARFPFDGGTALEIDGPTIHLR